MATLIENMVEAVIEDPVVDILAEPDTGRPTVSQVPALNSGPVGRRGRPQQSGGAVLPEERSSDTSDPNQGAADPGRDAVVAVLAVLSMVFGNLLALLQDNVKRIRPAVGLSRRTMHLPKVDFPQPDSPTRPSVSPAWMSRLTPSTAFTAPIWV